MDFFVVATFAQQTSNVEMELNNLFDSHVPFTGQNTNNNKQKNKQKYTHNQFNYFEMKQTNERKHTNYSETKQIVIFAIVLLDLVEFSACWKLTPA